MLFTVIYLIHFIIKLLSLLALGVVLSVCLYCMSMMYGVDLCDDILQITTSIKSAS